MYALFAILGLICAVDVPDHAVGTTKTRHPADHQSESMYRAIAVSHHSYNDMGIALAAQGFLVARDGWIAPYSPCLWQGVTCVQGVIHSVRWDSRIRFIAIDLGWFPATISRIEIREIGAQFLIFETRKLPRDLQSIHLKDGPWRGKIDMTTLPAHLKSFESILNNFEGTLSLIQLPYTLERVRIIGSEISMIFVDNEALPKSLNECIVETRAKFTVIAREKKPLDDRITVRKFEWKNFKY